MTEAWVEAKIIREGDEDRTEITGYSESLEGWMILGTALLDAITDKFPEGQKATYFEVICSTAKAMIFERKGDSDDG